MTGTNIHARSNLLTRGGRHGGQERRASRRYGRSTASRRDAGARVRRAVGRDAPRTIRDRLRARRHLLALRAAHPARDFLGVEVHRPAGGCLLMARGRRLANVRIICHDAVEGLRAESPRSPCTRSSSCSRSPGRRAPHKRASCRPFADLAGAASRRRRAAPRTDWQLALEMLRR